MPLLMPRRVASVTSLVAALAIVGTAPASAQVAPETLLPRAVLASAQTVTIEGQPSAMRTSTRPAPLVGLYVSLATLQALDITSTRSALNAGAVEANPLVARLAKSGLAMMALKAGATGAIIYATERLWRRNRAAAVVTMIALNAAHGAVVAHNLRVAASQKR